jgi:fructose-1,6-bisphosphatase/inositol monophosphatase family enzyme
MVGYAIHHTTSLFWATLYERTFGEPSERKTPLRRCAEAALSATGAYVVDYYLTPPRLRPGFKKHVRTQSMFVIYGAFALGLACASIIRDRNV